MESEGDGLLRSVGGVGGLHLERGFADKGDVDGLYLQDGRYLGECAEGEIRGDFFGGEVGDVGEAWESHWIGVY